jgi:glycosyltransferase involved in cell wall biosynthesis
MAEKIIVSVTTDLVTDQRVHKVCNSLCKEGYDVVLVGRKKKDSLPLNKRNYKTFRFNLFFEKGFLFYMSYNVRLFFFLMFSRVDILVANDLDTLLPNYLISKFKGIPLAYDNHEYFTGVPELTGRPFVRGIWKSIERFIFPRLKYVYTENESKRKLFEEEYKVPLLVVRNFPVQLPEKPASIQRPKWIGNSKVILYQGAVNKDRGIEEMVEAMQYLDDFVFLIIGTGDLYDSIQNKILHLGLSNKIKMTGLIPFGELPKYTSMADIGVSIEKDTNISYRYCLPNKVFDYIHAGVPVLVSTLLEMKLIVDKYQVGAFIHSHEPKEIADTVKKIFANPVQYNLWKANLALAANQLNWESEEKVLLDFYSKISTDISAQ